MYFYRIIMLSLYSIASLYVIYYDHCIMSNQAEGTAQRLSISNWRRYKSS